MGTAMLIIGYRNMDVEANQVLYTKGQTIVGISLVVSAAFNLALTLLTGEWLIPSDVMTTALIPFEAGRIWWITRVLNPSKTRATRIMNKIILESGMLYPLVTILHLGVVNSGPDPPLDTFPLVVLTAVR
ncbi:hypothetical protein PQX77_019630 [Marasmius sp. AFHP31]|nr:hypothetical protein PQX77_019630 [Marasmius sp. AFHP31]